MTTILFKISHNNFQISQGNLQHNHHLVFQTPELLWPLHPLHLSMIPLPGILILLHLIIWLMIYLSWVFINLTKALIASLLVMVIPSLFLILVRVFYLLHIIHLNSTKSYTLLLLPILCLCTNLLKIIIVQSLLMILPSLFRTSTPRTSYTRDLIHMVYITFMHPSLFLLLFLLLHFSLIMHSAIQLLIKCLPLFGTRDWGIHHLLSSISSNTFFLRLVIKSRMMILLVFIVV